jgi:hypothetical protein
VPLHGLSNITMSLLTFYSLLHMNSFSVSNESMIFFKYVFAPHLVNASCSLLMNISPSKKPPRVFFVVITRKFTYYCSMIFFFCGILSNDLIPYYNHQEDSVNSCSIIIPLLSLRRIVTVILKLMAKRDKTAFNYVMTTNML